MTDTPGSDTNTTISHLRAEVQAFVQERDWGKYHTPKNLGMSIAIEAAEIMEHFQWHSSELTVALVQEPEINKMVADELADVLVYCFVLADQAEIDLTRTVRSKMARNQKRFPIGYMPTSAE